MKTNYKTFILAASITFISWSSDTNAQSISAGGWHSYAICSDSTVKAFGENATGELGNGGTTDSNVPVTVTGLSGIIAVSGGGDQLDAQGLALKSDGTVWAWGSNLYGGLGNASPTGTFVTTPGQVLLISNIKAISAGGWHGAALKGDGTVWTWGWNADGQLGDATLVDKTIPVKVPGLTGVTKIASGTYHVLALKSDGTVWAWGDNISGQIGDGTSGNGFDRNTPVQVTGLTGVVSIAAGRFFSLAVKNDGSVWTWGENMYGQLGIGNTANSSVPVQVSGLTVSLPAIVACGAFHCMAVKPDNTVWSWGRNTYGNIGDGTAAHRYTPVQMTGMSNVVSLAGGTNFSLLQKNDGTMWGCGRNLSGQLCTANFLQYNTATQSTGLCPLMQYVGIAEQNEIASRNVSVFPNPSVTGKFTVEIKQMADYKIEIHNVIGEKIFESVIDAQMTNSAITIDLSSQASGIYYLTMRTGEFTFCKKLVK